MESLSSCRGMMVLGLLMGLLLLGGCGRYRVAVDYPPEQTFEQFRRYYWLAPATAGQPPSVYNSELMGTRAEALVEQALLTRGLTRTTERHQADLLVQWQLAVEERLAIDPLRADEGSYSRHPGAYDVTTPYGARGDYRKATLVIDLRQPTDNRLLWRGMAVRRVPTFTTPQQYRTFVAETLATVLARYPPKQKTD